MTDFVARLVDRTLGLVPVVVPSVPSRFAPSSLHSATELLSELQPEAEELEPRERAPAGSPNPGRDVVEGEVAPRAALDHGAARERREPVGPALQALLGAPASKLETPSPQRLAAATRVRENGAPPTDPSQQDTASGLRAAVRTDSAASAVRTDEPGIQQVAPRAASVSSAPARPARRDLGQLLLANEGVPSAELPRRGASAAPSREVREAQSAGAHAAAVEPGRARASAPDLEPTLLPIEPMKPPSAAVTPRPVPDQRVAQQDAEPPLRLTIGRIEVRAAPPAAAPSAPAPWAPTLTLDAYLQRRRP
jgi:hypothetical protein